METEEAIRRRAVIYATSHKKRIVAALTDMAVHPAEMHPVSVFMAGSSGAGKTETAKALIDSFEAEEGWRILRIDPDDLRKELPGYDGRNSWLFQGAVSALVARAVDVALKQNQSFLLDGTFASYAPARQNVERSLARGRTVQILYTYQDPRQAWEFVCRREEIEGRRVPRHTFIDQYFAAREVVNRVKREFGGEIQVDALQKDNDGSPMRYFAGIDRIDSHIPEKYDRAAVEKMLV